MSHPSDSAERAILAGYHAAINDLASTVLALEACSTDFELAKVQRTLEIRATGINQGVLAIAAQLPHSESFARYLDGLTELLAGVVPDYTVGIDWDGELTELNEGAA